MTKKKDTTNAKPISFRCPADLKQDIEDLARLSRKDVSSILIELCAALSKANKERLTKFRQSAGQPIKMPTLAAPAPKKKAAAKNETSTANDAQATVDAAEKGGVENENS